MNTPIFKNFSVCDLRSSAVPDFGFGRTPHLFLLALEALQYCGKMEVNTNGQLIGFTLATDESVSFLASKINELANLALNSETEFRWVGFEGKTKNAQDCTVFELAFEGLFLAEDDEVAHYQISGIAALWLIDNAISVIKIEGLSKKLLEMLSEAALFLSQAASVYKDLYTTSAERNEAILKEREFIKKQSSNASQKAKLRYAKDPKQEEKKFINECWNDWREKPNQYKSNADFARAMLDKCEYIISHKNITDWCREWKKQSESVGLPAH